MAFSDKEFSESVRAYFVERVVAAGFCLFFLSSADLSSFYLLLCSVFPPEIFHKKCC